MGEKAASIRETWEAIYRGTGNHRIAVLEDGLKFRPITIPPNEAQFLETRKYQLSEIARIFGVPPHMLGDLDRATFSNIEHQSIEFVTRTINPWVKRLEQSMDLALLTYSERKMYSIRFNLDAMLRGDYKTRMEGYKIGRQNGWLSANDIRDLEHMNPIPAEEGGNRYLVNGNMTDLKTVGHFARNGD
jgi:HK97 family phage portal protein